MNEFENECKHPTFNKMDTLYFYFLNGSKYSKIELLKGFASGDCDKPTEFVNLATPKGDR